MGSIHFQNRAEAASRLLPLLGKCQGKPDTLVLGLARGGVILAAELGKGLDLPFYPFIVRKIGHPGNPEYAIGAMSEGGTTVLNEHLGFREDEVRDIIEAEQAEMKRRLEAYRKDKPLPLLTGKTILLTDDGIATGATMQVAVRDLKKSGASRVIVAVPVSSVEAAHLLSQEADQFISLDTPADFYAVGQFYRDFPQVSDEEVIGLLKNPAVGT